MKSGRVLGIKLYNLRIQDEFGTKTLVLRAEAEMKAFCDYDETNAVLSDWRVFVGKADIGFTDDWIKLVFTAEAEGRLGNSLISGRLTRPCYGADGGWELLRVGSIDGFNIADHTGLASWKTKPGGQASSY
jgi:hypothetical protein